MQPSSSPLHPHAPPSTNPQGLGWQQVAPEAADAPLDQHPLGSPQQRTALAKGLVRPAGPAQMCD